MITINSSHMHLNYEVPPFLGAMYHKVAIYVNVQEVMCNGEVIGDMTESLAYLLGRSCVHEYTLFQ